MYDHARALAHERARDPETDALRRAGDERVTIGESHAARLYAACARGRRGTRETAASDPNARWSRTFGRAAEAEAGRAEAAARAAASSSARNRRGGGGRGGGGGGGGRRLGGKGGRPP